MQNTKKTNEVQKQWKVFKHTTYSAAEEACGITETGGDRKKQDDGLNR